jgi:hypothetical protein
LFFLRAERILAAIEELGPDECDETIEMLRQQVPPLTASEVLAAFTENLRWYRRWWEQNGGGPSDAEILKMVRETKGMPGPM